MKIAIINDTHLGARGENPHVDAFFFKFWDNIFFPHLQKHNIATVLHLGDVVDRRKFVNYKILNNWRINFFERLEGEQCVVHFLLGNHDIFHSASSDVNALDELVGHYDNFYIHKKATDLHYYEDGPFALIPWINEGNIEHTMKFLETSNARIAFGHLEIAGFEMDKGHVCLEGFPRELFKRFEKVYTGHYHHKSDDGHIFYLGNQYEITWVDYNDQRGFHVFDTETLEMEFVPNPYRLFHKLVYNDEMMNFEYWKSHDFSVYEGTFVKLIILKKQNPYLFDSVLNMLYKAKPLDVNVVEDFSESPVATTEPSGELDQAEDTMTILSKFIDTNCSLDKISPDKLKLLMKELYLEALDTEHTS